MNEQRLRKRIIDTCLQMSAKGLNKGTAGNLGVRYNDGFLITPSGLPYEETYPVDIVFMNFAGEASGRRKPSSEWRFHRDILTARPDVNVVLHAHSPFATALACLRKDIPAFHYMIAVTGAKTLRCAHYATFGSQELSEHAVGALHGSKACLLANHGMIVVAESLKAALSLGLQVEGLCEQYWRAQQAGDPVILDDAEMDRVLEKFKTYGANTEDSQAKSS
ncbi:MAG: class II aldolase/adducin family protein [Burkholderiales bacterium]